MAERRRRRFGQERGGEGREIGQGREIPRRRGARTRGGIQRKARILTKLGQLLLTMS